MTRFIHYVINKTTCINKLSISLISLVRSFYEQNKYVCDKRNNAKFLISAYPMPPRKMMDLKQWRLRKTWIFCICTREVYTNKMKRLHKLQTSLVNYNYTLYNVYPMVLSITYSLNMSKAILSTGLNFLETGGEKYGKNV